MIKKDSRGSTGFMRTCLLILTLILLVSKLQSQSFTWAHGAGTWVTDKTYKIIGDSQGNTYITGHVYDGTSFGTYVGGGGGTYVTKYSSTGTVLWAKFAIDAYNGTGRALALDSQGNIYVGGDYSYQLNFGDTVLHGAHQTTPFLAKYSSTGNLLWAKNIGVPGENGWPICGGLAIDDDDNVYMTGIFSGVLRLEGGITIFDANPTYWGYYNIFLVKYDKNGNIKWGKGGGTANYDNYAVDLVSAPGNSILLAAAIGGNSALKFGSIIETGLTSGGSVILEFTQSGEIKWSSVVNGTITDIEVSNDDHVLATGLFSNRIYFDGGYSLYSEQPTNFIVKYESDRSVGWSKRIDNGGAYTWHPPYIAEHKGNIFLSASYAADFKVDGQEIDSGESGDAYVMKITDFGYLQWVKVISHGDYWERTRINSITVTSKGTIAVTGEYTGDTLDLDAIHLTNNSGNDDEDIFIAAIADNTSFFCPLNNPILASDAVICAGSSVALTPTYEPTAMLPVWYRNGQPIGRWSDSYKETRDGNYSYVLYSNTVCADTSNTVSIIVVEHPVAEISVSPGLVRCDGQDVSLETIEDEHYSYQWFFNSVKVEGEEKSNFTASQSGVYKVAVSNGVCATISPLREVTIVEPVEDFLPDTLWICVHEPVELKFTLPTKNWYFQWSTGMRSPAIVVADSGTYELTVSQAGCKYLDQVVVRQRPSLWIPNIITPNGDGKNFYLI
jgi:hypothetical protein